MIISCEELSFCHQVPVALVTCHSHLVKQLWISAEAIAYRGNKTPLLLHVAQNFVPGRLVQSTQHSPWKASVVDIAVALPSDEISVDCGKIKLLHSQEHSQQHQCTPTFRGWGSQQVHSYDSFIELEIEKYMYRRTLTKLNQFIAGHSTLGWRHWQQTQTKQKHKLKGTLTVLSDEILNQLAHTSPRNQTQCVFHAPSAGFLQVSVLSLRYDDMSKSSQVWGIFLNTIIRLHGVYFIQNWH